LFQVEFWKNGRHLKFRLKKDAKNRIAEFCKIYFPLTSKFYIGGSQYKFNSKYPRKDSDVDLYIFNSNFTNIEFDKEASLHFTLALGYKIQIFTVSKKFQNPVTQGMEQLIYE
jgi:hypothetical protein